MTENNEQLKQLLTEILANQQSLHEAFSAVHSRLSEIDGSLITIVRDNELKSAQQDEESDNDALFYIAREAVVEAGQASTSYLQRKLRIGYSRAARLIDLLEESEIISVAHGAKPRTTLVTPEELKLLIAVENKDVDN